MNALTIARFTLQEAISRRLILAGLLLSLAFIALYTLGFTFLYGKGVETSRGAAGALGLMVAVSTLVLLGLYAVNFLASFLALFVSVGAISGEVDSGALHAVLARPIHRAEFVLGRWLAYVGLVAAYIVLMTGLLFFVAYWIAGYTPPDPIRAVGLMILEAIVLLTLSLFGSTLLSTLANGVAVFSLFGLAWLAGIIEFVGGAFGNAAMVNLGIGVSLLVPSDAIWRAASYYVLSPIQLAALTAGRGAIPFVSVTPPTTALVLWALAYPVVFVLAAAYAFSRRDL